MSSPSRVSPHIFLPVRPYFSTILCKFAHKKNCSFGCHPLEGVTRGGPPPPPVTSLFMGVDQGGTSPTEFGIEDANANCLLGFCYIGTKRSFLWPDPAGGAHDAPPDRPLVGWGSIHHPARHRPTLDARHASPKIPARSTHMVPWHHLILTLILTQP